MFKKKPTLQECEKEFNVLSLQIGSLQFEMKQIQSSINKKLSEMEALAKRGKELREKIQEEVAEKVAEGEQMKAAAPNEIN